MTYNKIVLCGRSENKDGRPGLWLADPCPIVSLQPLEFDEAWQEAKTKSPLLTLCLYSGRSENKYGRQGLWFTETFFTLCLQPLNGIWLNLIGSKYLTSSTKLKVGGGGHVNSSTKMASLTSESLSLFRLFLGATPERYLTNLGWSKYTYCPLPCFFLRTDTPTMVVDDTHVHVKRLSGLLLLFIMLLKYGDNGSKCEFLNAQSAFFSKIRKVASLSCMPTAVL